MSPFTRFDAPVDDHSGPPGLFSDPAGGLLPQTGTPATTKRQGNRTIHEDESVDPDLRRAVIANGPSLHEYRRGKMFRSTPRMTFRGSGAKSPAPFAVRSERDLPAGAGAGRDTRSKPPHLASPLGSLRRLASFGARKARRRRGRRREGGSGSDQATHSSSIRVQTSSRTCRAVAAFGSPALEMGDSGQLFPTADAGIKKMSLFRVCLRADLLDVIQRHRFNLGAGAGHTLYRPATRSRHPPVPIANRPVDADRVPSERHSTGTGDGMSKPAVVQLRFFGYDLSRAGFGEPARLSRRSPR